MSKARSLLLIAIAAVVAGQVAACKKPKDPVNAQEMKEKLSDKVGWALWKIDATEEQEALTDRMLDGLAPDLFRFQKESRAIKRNIIRIMAGEKVNLDDLLKQQKTGVELFDRYTTRMSHAAVEAADILDLEQRRELVRMWRNWEFGDDED